MWLGGALFVAHILVDPFVAAKRPWLNAQQGPLRVLPVELTLVNDLPVRLDQGRSRISHGEDPELLLYYLDENAWRPEPPGIWVAGRARADIIVRTNPPVSTMEVTLRSPIANTVTVTVDGSRRIAMLSPNETFTMRFPVSGVHARGAQSFVVQVETDDGFVPRLRDATSNDGRYLGVAVRLDGIL